MPGGDTRDTRAIAAVPCPQCNAWAGKPCFYQGKPTLSLPGKGGRPYIHPERRAAWLEWKREQPREDGGR